MNNYLTADDDMRDWLYGILEPVEIRDSRGQVLGVFTPHVPVELLALYEKAKADVDVAELKRRIQEGGQRRTTAQVLERLRDQENLACDTR